MAKKILVIEDDPAAARFISYTLEQKGYQILTASNGQQGLMRAKDEEPDLLILDVMLPGMDGFQICRKLRAKSQTSRIPILMLSAKTREADKAYGIKVGADVYLTKPTDPAELVRQAERLLARESTVTARTIAFLGSIGGVGTSTVAVNVAVAISQRNRRVILADLCPYCGKVSSLLGLKPEHTMAELFNGSAGSLGRDELEAILTRHSTGVGVLPSPRTAEEYRKFSPSNAQSLLEILGGMADYVIADIPYSPSEGVRSILKQFDIVVLVASAWSDGLIGVDSKATLLEKMDIDEHWLAAMGINQQQLTIVVVDREGLFSHVIYSEMKPIIESIIKIPFLGVISHDADLFPGFESQSVPQILTKPQHPIAVSLKQLAEQLFACEFKAAGNKT